MSHKYAQASYLRADEHVTTKVKGDKTMDRQSTSYKKKMYTVAALVVLIIVSISGCTDKPEEVQDEVNVYIYEQTGEDGDPQEQIREFYDMVDEQSGPPVLVPLRKYAAEYELDPETGKIILDTAKIYDPDGNPVDRETALAMQDNIATDDAGNIITDAALLDLHIKPIGKDKYQINNVARELPVEDGVWRISHEMVNKYSGDTKFNDNIFKIGDLDDMYGGFVLGEDGKPYGVIFVDEDTFKLYDGDFDSCAMGENPHGIDKHECVHLGNGIYVYLYDLSEIHNGLAVCSPHPISRESPIAEKNHGLAQFMFVKGTP